MSDHFRPRLNQCSILHHIERTHFLSLRQTFRDCSFYIASRLGISHEDYISKLCD